MNDWWVLLQISSIEENLESHLEASMENWWSKKTSLLTVNMIGGMLFTKPSICTLYTLIFFLSFGYYGEIGLMVNLYKAN